MREILERAQAAELALRIKREQRHAELDVESIEAQFGALETVEDAQRRLERLSVWCSAGLLQSGLATAAVRSVEAWVRAEDSRLTREVVDDLKAQVAELKAKLKPRVA